MAGEHQTTIVFVTGGEIVVDGEPRQVAEQLAPAADGRPAPRSQTDWPALVLADGTEVFVNRDTVAYLTPAQRYRR